MDGMVARKRLVDGRPTSLCDLGYCDVGLDDNWQQCGRYGADHDSYHTTAGYPIVNQSRFPDLKAMTSHAHGLGALCLLQDAGGDRSAHVDAPASRLRVHTSPSTRTEPSWHALTILSSTSHHPLNIPRRHQLQPWLPRTQPCDSPSPPRGLTSGFYFNNCICADHCSDEKCYRGEPPSLRFRPSRLSRRYPTAAALPPLPCRAGSPRNSCRDCSRRRSPLTALRKMGVASAGDVGVLYEMGFDRVKLRRPLPLQETWPCCMRWALME